MGTRVHAADEEDLLDGRGRHVLLEGLDGCVRLLREFPRRLQYKSQRRATEGSEIAAGHCDQ